MPHNLEDERGNIWRGIAQLEESPSETTTSYEDADMSESPARQSPGPNAGSRDRTTIKPYVQALTWMELDACVKLEEVTFPPEERCSREKFEYRFAKCGELSLGLFTSAIPSQNPSTDTTRPLDPSEAMTAPLSAPVYSGTPERKCVLLGHVIATKTTNSTVRDEDMAIPTEWREEHKRGMSSPSRAGATTSAEDGKVVQGHKEEGRTLIIHSLAVLPGFQKRGLAKLLLRSYIQRIESSGVADRIAIISHEGLVGFYEGMGFENRGKSSMEFGGGGWTDLVLDLKGED